MNNYEQLTDHLFVARRSRREFAGAECIAFDCDGTMVDSRESYDACIKRVGGLMLAQVLGRKGLRDVITDEIILKFRMTGGFNNDTDTAYAAILGAFAARTDHVGRARRFILDVAANAGPEGISSAERYLERRGLGDLATEAKEALAYPGAIGSSVLGTAFDELFYGARLFRKQHGLRPGRRAGKGLINLDRLMISRECLDSVRAVFGGKVSIVSGRSKVAATHSLRSVLRYFDLTASVFIEDEDKRAIAWGSGVNARKPEPFSMIKSMDAMRAQRAVYVGDSAEDLLMSKRASTGRRRVLFCGVHGDGRLAPEIAAMFRARGADAIMQSVNDLPAVLPPMTPAASRPGPTRS
ncbi:MAG: hypothetical protein RDV41_01210 [Planctomycetota bacterium]|nr:hypothetical protein [Planctomycetota bacterium]